LAAAISYKPDLALLDVMMPKVSGFDVLDILRNTPETANLKVIMLTALSQDSDKERAQALGVEDYLVKSQVVISDVIDRIRHHLS
jgi:CheY-like chemotaxis protein